MGIFRYLVITYLDKKVCDYVNRLLNQEFIENIITELRVKGFYFIINEDFTEDDANIIYTKILKHFSNVLFFELNQEKKFFIVNIEGKKSVLKLIDSSIYNLKRRWVTSQQKNESFELHYKEWERQIELRKIIEKHRF